MEVAGSLIEWPLWIVCILCEMALCITIVRRNLLLRYPALFSLALVNAVRDVSLATITDVTAKNYSRLWLITLPILMSVQVASVIEAYSKFTAQYKRLEVFANYLLRACLALLLLFSWICAARTFHPFRDSVLQAVIFSYRYLALVLVGCLVLPFFVLSRFPKPAEQPARNVSLHLWLLVVYLGVYGVGSLSVNLLGGKPFTITVINIIMLFVFCGLYILWASLLTAKGESFVPWPQLAPDLIALMDRHGDAAVSRGTRLKDRLAAEHR